MTPAALPTAVEARFSEATTSLAQATGGRALCRIDGSPGTVKSLEGRAAALAEVRRILRDDPSAELGPLQRRWHADLAAHRRRGSARAWLDYAEGGALVIDELLAEQAPRPVAGSRT